MTIDNPAAEESAPWKPIGRRARRVLGVLIEKAKTTPDSYPLSIAALVAGCNQKSNRDPQMQLDEDEVVETLDLLRGLGAVREVQGSGRVNKYRHAAYEWLGVTAPQVAVMTELLLRGPQTAGELRARAARMEAFADLAELTRTLDELQARGLVVPLSPPGRGQTFAHALYEPDEWARLTASQAPAAAARPAPATAEPEPAAAADPAELEQLRAELDQLKRRLERLEKELGIEPA